MNYVIEALQLKLPRAPYPFIRLWSQCTTALTTASLGVFSVVTATQSRNNSARIWQIRSAWSNYFWPVGHITKTWQFAGHFQRHDVWNKRSTTFKSYIREDKWVRHWKYYTTANSNLLQIPVSGMPLIEASLTLSFCEQYQC